MTLERRLLNAKFSISPVILIAQNKQTIFWKELADFVVIVSRIIYVKEDVSNKSNDKRSLSNRFVSILGFS